MSRHCVRVLAIVPVLAVACATDARDQSAPMPGTSAAVDDGSDPGSDSGIDGGGSEGPRLDLGGSTAGNADGGEGGACPCQAVQDGIYVLDADAPPTVYFYAPLDNTFTAVGEPGCPADLGTVANSMAIEREGNAWFNYYTPGFPAVGELYHAPLGDLGSCEPSGYESSAGWTLFGMGYSVDGPGDNCDRLFVYDNSSFTGDPSIPAPDAQLGRFDGDTVTVVGTTDYPAAELTGTGDGRLFAFASQSSGDTFLVELDKSDGHALATTPLPGLPLTQAWAFAFWGGDVYFFTETSTGSGVSKVTRLDYDGNAGGGLSVVQADTGLHITGAGVSTCASYTPQG